jgi:hypothetical protein
MSVALTTMVFDDSTVFQLASKIKSAKPVSIVVIGAFECVSCPSADKADLQWYSLRR